MYQRISSKNSSEWGEEAVWKWGDFNCHWRELGFSNKKPLLLLHGFGASSAHWRYNAHYFANKGFKVYALDLIGFGKSDQPEPKKLKKIDNHFWSMQVAAFLEEIVNTKENGKAVLIGNSLGGLVALTTAAFNPELVDSVVAAPLPDPALIHKDKRKQSKFFIISRNLLINIFFKFLPLELLIPIIINTNLVNFALQSAYNHSIIKDSELKRIIIEPAKRKSAPRALRAMCIGMATRKDTITAPLLLQRISFLPIHTSILLIWGKQDKFVPLSVGKKLLHQYPWLKLFIFENAGHCPHDESPSDFNKYVLDWLKNNSGGYIQQT